MTNAMDEIRCDVLILGASLGGVAAANSAASAGAEVVLVEESNWLGGQLTSQGVCTPDENRWIEQGGGTVSYKALRERIREHYTEHYRRSPIGLAQTHFNPGKCWVSRISTEPRYALDLLTAMLSQWQNLHLRRRARVLEVERRIDRISAVIVGNENGSETRFLPTYVLDATELGDLLPMAGVDHVVGAESRAETGEPDAPESAHPEWIQPFTFPFALEMRSVGEDHTIPKPPRYDEMKELQKYHILDGAMKGMFGELSWWTYRRILAAENFESGVPHDVAMVNTGSNDFKGGVIPSGDQELDRQILEAGRLASLGYVYWLQTECPRVDDPSRKGYPEFKLRGDLFSTQDGIAPHPYIRESRRLKALTTVYEQDIVSDYQHGPRAKHFPDSCGIGHYWLDIHEGGTEEPFRFLETKPFQIPLGALIPRNVANLIAACKNLGVTHLTNGAYRLHPIEWNIGESAGAMAAYCAANNVTPRELHGNPTQLQAFQDVLINSGIPLYWWADLPAGHPAFKPAQRLAMRRIWPDEDTLEFRPDEPLSPDLAAELEERTGIQLEEGISRSQAAARIDSGAHR